MRKINEIIVHCSATPAGKPYTVEDIDKWHRQRGFDGIGYHFVVYLDGSVLFRTQQEQHRRMLYRWPDGRRQSDK